MRFIGDGLLFQPTACGGQRRFSLDAGSLYSLQDGVFVKPRSLASRVSVPKETAGQIVFIFRGLTRLVPCTAHSGLDESRRAEMGQASQFAGNFAEEARRASRKSIHSRISVAMPAPPGWEQLGHRDDAGQIQPDIRSPPISTPASKRTVSARPVNLCCALCNSSEKPIWNCNLIQPSPEAGQTFSKNSGSHKGAPCTEIILLNQTGPSGHARCGRVWTRAGQRVGTLVAAGTVGATWGKVASSARLPSSQKPSRSLRRFRRGRATL